MQAPRPVRPIRPLSNQLNPNKVYARSAISAPLPYGDFRLAGQRARAIQSSVQSLFDVGVNPAVAEGVRRRYNIQDETWRNTSENVGSVVGGAVGTYKGLAFTAGIVSAAVTKGLTFTGGIVGKAATTANPWVIGGAVLVGAIYTAATTLSGMYTGKFVGGLLTPSGMAAAGELIRDVMIGLQTDFAATATYATINLTSTILLNWVTKGLSKDPSSKVFLKRTLTGMASHLISQEAMSLTGLLDEIDPNRTNIMSLTGNTYSQISHANAVRGLLTGLTDKDANIMENLKLAYGVSEDGYRPFYFSEIRSNLNIDWGLQLNQVIDYIGNTLTDPGTYMSRAERVNKKKTKSNIEESLKNTTNPLLLQLLGKDGVNASYLAEFILNNVENLDSINTYHLFVNIMGNNVDLSSMFSALKDIEKFNFYKSFIGAAVEGLTDRDLDYFSSLKYNKKVAKGLTEVVPQSEMERLIVNEFANLNFKTIGREFNINAAKYQAFRNYNAMQNSLISAVGWANPVNKLLNMTPSIVASLKKRPVGVDPLLVKNSEGAYVLSIEGHKQLNARRAEKVEQRNAAITKLEEERDAKLLEADSKYAVRLHEIESQISILKEALKKEKEHLDKLNESLNYEMTTDNGRVINSSNVHVFEKQLEKLNDKYAKTKDPEIRKERDELERDINSFNYFNTANYKSAEAEYTLNTLKTQGNALEDLYTVMVQVIDAEFETVPGGKLGADGKPQTKDVAVPISAKYKAQQRLVNAYKITPEDAKGIWDIYVKRFLNKRLPPDLDEFDAVTQEGLTYIKQHERDFFNSEGVLINYPEKFNMDSATAYQKRLYYDYRFSQSALEPDSELGKLVSSYRVLAYNLKNEVNKYTEVDPYDLIEDPVARERYIKELRNIAEKFTTGRVGRLIQGPERVFPYLVPNTFSDETAVGIINNIIPSEGSPVYSSDDALLAVSEVDKTLTKRNKTIENVKNVISVLETEQGKEKEIRILNTFINYLTTGDFHSLITDDQGQVDRAVLEALHKQEEGDPLTPDEQDSVDYFDLLLEEFKEEIENLNIEDVTFEMLEGYEETSISNLKTIKDNLEIIVDEKEAEKNADLNLTVMEVDNDTPLIELIDFTSGEAGRLAEIVGVTNIVSSEAFIKGQTLHSIIVDETSKKVGLVKIVDSNLVEKDVKDILFGHEEELPLPEITETVSFIEDLRYWLSKVIRSEEDGTYDDYNDHFTDDIKRILFTEYGDVENIENIMNFFVNSKRTSSNNWGHFIDLDKLETLIEGTVDIKDKLKENTIYLRDKADEVDTSKQPLGEKNDPRVHNVIKSFSNHKMTVHKNGRDKETNVLEFILDYGSDLEKEKLYNILGTVYTDLKPGGKISDEELLDIVNTTVISETSKHTSQFHDLNNLRRDVAQKFVSAKAQNNIPLLEVTKNKDIIYTINALHKVLNLNKPLTPGEIRGDNNLDFLNDLVGVDLEKTEYMHDHPHSGKAGFKTKLRNMVLKTNLINKYTKEHNLNDNEKLVYMDFLDRFSKMGIFKMNADGTDMVINKAYVRETIEKLLDNKLYSDHAFLKPVLEQVLDIREDIMNKGDQSEYYNFDLSQKYDRHFADMVKDTLYNTLSIYKEASSGGVVASQMEMLEGVDMNLVKESARYTFKSKASGVGTLIGVLNRPLTRQTARNNLLLDKLVTPEYINKSIYQQDPDFTIDMKKFKELNPNVNLESLYPEEALNDQTIYNNLQKIFEPEKQRLVTLDNGEKILFKDLAEYRKNNPGVKVERVERVEEQHDNETYKLMFEALKLAQIEISSEWLTDNRFNLAALISEGSPLGLRTTYEMKTASNVHRLSNIYYKESFMSQGFQSRRTATGGTARTLDSMITHVLEEFTPLGTPGKRITRKNTVKIGHKQIYLTSLNRFNTMSQSSPEFTSALNYYDEHLSKDISEEVITFLKGPSVRHYRNADTSWNHYDEEHEMSLPMYFWADFDKEVEKGFYSPVEENLVKASLARAHMTINANTPANRETYAEGLKLRSEIKAEIEVVKEHIRNMEGTGVVTMQDDVPIPGLPEGTTKRHEVLFNIIDNRLPEGELENYILQATGKEMTDGDREWFIKRQQIKNKLNDPSISEFKANEYREQLELDFKNPPEFMANYLNIKKERLHKNTVLIKKTREHYEPLIENAETPEEERKLQIEMYGRLKSIKKVAEEDLYMITEDGYAHISEWTTDSELSELYEERKLIKEETDELKQKIYDEYTEKRAELNAKHSNMDLEKYNEINDIIMESLHSNNTDRLIEILNETYPGSEEFIRSKVINLMAKYTVLKEDLGREVVTVQKVKVPVGESNGETVYVEVPETTLVEDVSPYELEKFLNDPLIKDEYKRLALAGKYDEIPEGLLITNKRNRRTYNKEKVDLNFVEQYNEILGSDLYTEFILEQDEHYQRSLQNLKYELHDELFEITMTLEDSMWNAGVEDPLNPEQNRYASEILRTRQLSNYFNIGFSDVVAMFTDDKGAIDYDGIINAFVKDPNQKLVGIVRDDTGTARELSVRSKEDGKQRTDKLEADSNTPVVKQLKIETKEDIEYILEQVEEGFQVGFMTEDNFSTANRISYKPYKLPKGLDMAYNALVSSQKRSALFDVGFTPQVIIDTITKNTIAGTSTIGEDAALTFGVKTYRYHTAWNVLQGERMSDMQELLQLEHDVREGVPGAEERFREIKGALLNESVTNPSDELTTLLEQFKFGEPTDQIKNIYWYLNKLNIGKYAATPMYQNSLFSKNENSISNRANISKNFLEKLDMNILSEVNDFMKSNAVSAESSKIRNGMVSFMKENPHLQISEEHYTWLYYQNPKALESKTMLNPNNLMTFQISAARNINTIGKLHGFLLGKHLYGDSVDQGISRSLKTHFSHQPQNRSEVLLNFLFPYTKVASHNMMFWDQHFNNASTHRIMYNLTISAWGAWQEKYDPDRNNEYAKRLMYQGMVPLGENNFLKMSPQRRMYNNFNLVQNPDSGMLYRMNPLIRDAVSKLVRPSDEKSWISMDAVPYLGRASSYISEFGERQGLSKYVPSMFGYMNTYHRRSYVPYKNLYKQLYTARGKYRTPSTDPIQTVRSIQYRMAERRYR